MSYQALARKWRPRNFSELVGQPHIVNALSHQLATNTLHHAYLFTGTRGVGKTTIARLLAKSLNCLNNGVSANPCCQCENCLDLDAGKFIDLIEVDAASRTGVDDTRELIESVSYLPAKGTHKVYLIDEVHMFSKSSFNALLKTLEEPPPYVKFVLATTDPEKLPVTILSRCLQFNLKRYSEQTIFEHLQHICTQEDIQFDPMALQALAKAGSGSMRDTLSLTDQALAFGQGKLNIQEVTMLLGTVHPADIDQLIIALMTRDANRLFATLQKMTEFEVDCEQLLVAILTRLKHLAWQVELTENAQHTNEKSWLTCIEDSYQSTLLQLWYDIGQKALTALPRNVDTFGLLEMTLLRMLAFTPKNAIKQSAVDEIQKASESAPSEIENIENLAEHKVDNNSEKDIKNNNNITKSVKVPSAIDNSAKALNNTQNDVADISLSSTAQDAVSKTNKVSLKNHEITSTSLSVEASDSFSESLVDAEAQFVEKNGIDITGVSQDKMNQSDNLAQNTSVSVASESSAANRQDPSCSVPQYEETPHQVTSETTLSDKTTSDEFKVETVQSEAIVEKTPESGVAKSTQSPVAELEYSSPPDWATLVSVLPLSEYESAVADLGELMWLTSTHAVLQYPDEHELDTDAILCAMRDALSSYFQREINVDIEMVTRDKLTNTPAQQRAKHISANKDAIKTAFYEHPIVVDIMTNLNAKVAADEITFLADIQN